MNCEADDADEGSVAIVSIPIEILTVIQLLLFFPVECSSIFPAYEEI